ncbi:MAG TPA: hypothetical protein VFB04_05210 [Terriglobales bacterium]|nr:hypothetical protein [Terriglobales bacterium]
MPHALTSAMIAELAKANIRPRIFLEAEFTSGTIYVWSDVTPIDWNGHTWTGIGHLGSISPAPETTEVRADNIVISLSGIPSSLVSKVLGEVRPNYPVKVWFGCLSESGAVIADPYLTFQGLMDVPTIQENGQTATISITVENRMVDLQRARERRYTDKDQQQLYPGDKFFEYVPSLADWNGIWGKGNQMAGALGSENPDNNVGTCFSGNTRVLTLAGPVAFDNLGRLSVVLTDAGLRIAELIVHEPAIREMLDMGDGELVTPDHLIRIDGSFHPARDRFLVSAVHCGPVYNLHVRTFTADERHYYLANGIVAHNLKAAPGGG